jgi:hypothetical protein
MKYLITESKLNKVIFNYLDNQDFIQIDKGERIYFANSENDEDAQIKYDKGDSSCLINMDLVSEIHKFFSLTWEETEEFITIWVSNTLNREVSKTNVYTTSRWF